MMTRANSVGAAAGSLAVGLYSLPRSPSGLRVNHLAGDLARGVGGREAGVAARVVDDFGHLVFGEPVVAGDLDVEVELVGGA